MFCSLYNFSLIRPRFEIPQEHILEWIAKAHAVAQATQDGVYSETLYQDVKERLFRLGFGTDKIQSRGIHILDLFEKDFGNMPLFPVGNLPSGKTIRERSDFFETEMDPIFEAFYPEQTPLPSHLIHVTCTGYVAPNPAQKLVSRRGAGATTTVTNAYHMGCFAAFPAIRMGAGYLRLPSQTPITVDVVHTEVGSIHMQPLKHSTEQLMVQSLFADGFIKYSISPSAAVPHFQVLALLEEVIPNSSEKMTWRCDAHGFVMTIGKEVPVLITRALASYLERLYALAEKRLFHKTYFAVHPGGPKILDYVKQALHLETDQMKHSYEILRKCGNMSSATLPHVWQLMLDDPSVEEGSLIVSLAFGPGLSISGALMEKRGGSCSY